MNRLFWSLIIFEAVIAFGLAIVLILFPGKGGPNVLDSLVGRAEAGLSMLLVAVSLVYWNTRSPAVHLSLLILAAAPLVVGAAYGVIFLRGPVNEHVVTKHNDDRLLMFDGEPMLTRFVVAIYEQDSSKVRALSPHIDINAVSASGNYTPLKLAVERAVEAEVKPEAADRALEMVRLLLSLGAKPNSGLHAACFHSSRTAAVRILLEAGADPNNLGPSGKGPPAFYGCFSSQRSGGARHRSRRTPLPRRLGRGSNDVELPIIHLWSRDHRERSDQTPTQSLRRAVIGSSCDARRAGMKLASAAIAISNPAADANVTGSEDLRPNRSDSAVRPAASDRTAPTITPIANRIAASRITMRTT